MADDRIDFSGQTLAEREAVTLALRHGIDLEDRLRLAMRLSVADASPHDLRTMAGRAIVLARRREHGAEVMHDGR